ncbi:hypothetical protein ACMD2_00852 [Ananas comosus]|uniref:Uncharacterized protein n=1 Tax=Ananas comosus TaxID=4615 RepID=A0A199UM69_ANACO|nr:hypothetical protein ACMD2_00852 [Ananas comosus]
MNTLATDQRQELQLHPPERRRARRHPAHGGLPPPRAITPRSSIRDPHRRSNVVDEVLSTGDFNRRRPGAAPPHPTRGGGAQEAKARGEARVRRRRRRAAGPDRAAPADQNGSPTQNAAHRFHRRVAHRRAAVALAAAAFAMASGRVSILR